MRCPAIEGIETRLLVDAHRAAGRVECVAPLLRGLKPNSSYRQGLRGLQRRMRCPAIEGIETQRLRLVSHRDRRWSNALPRY